MLIYARHFLGKGYNLYLHGIEALQRPPSAIYEYNFRNFSKYVEDSFLNRFRKNLMKSRKKKQAWHRKLNVAAGHLIAKHRRIHQYEEQLAFYNEKSKMKFIFKKACKVRNKERLMW